MSRLSQNKLNKTIAVDSKHDPFPTEYISVGTLQMPDPMGVSFDSGTRRFTKQMSGSFFANATAIPTSFKVVDQYRKTKVPAHEDIPKGRPLWLQELRKEVPAGTEYDADSTFGSNKVLYKTRAHSFKNSYQRYQRTCDI